MYGGNVHEEALLLEAIISFRALLIQKQVLMHVCLQSFARFIFFMREILISHTPRAPEPPEDVFSISSFFLLSLFFFFFLPFLFSLLPFLKFFSEPDSFPLSVGHSHFF